MRPPSRIVLVGFMAAGKSTVGRVLARRLGWRFVDLDREVARLAGRPVREIIRGAGEEEFRRLESLATAALDDLSQVVIAAGGGWMARPELRDRWPDAVRVLLRVSPDAAVSRLGDRLPTRPLLDPVDPLGSARRLLAAREPAYERAEVTVETEGKSPGEVADEILHLLGTAGTIRIPDA